MWYAESQFEPSLAVKDVRLVHIGRAALAATAALVAASCARTVADNPDTAYESRDFGSYVAGLHARYSRDTEAAAQFYLDALKKDPNNGVLLRRAFSLLVTDGQYREAVSLARRIVASSPRSSLANMILVIEHFRKEEYDAARKRLVNITGSGFDALMRPLMDGWAHAGEGDGAQALDSLKPLSASPAFVHYGSTHAAYILQYLKDYAAAEEAYEALLAETPLKTVLPALAYASLLARQGRWSDAEMLLDELAEDFPSNRRIAANRVKIRARQVPPSRLGAPRKALSEALVQAAAELMSDNARAPALLYARLGSFMAPENDDAHLLLGNLLSIDGHQEAALTALRKIDPDSDLYLQSKLREAWVLDGMERSDAAIAVLEDYLVAHPGNPEIHTSLGDIHRAKNDFESAVEQYTLAIAATPVPVENDWFLFFVRGISNERLKRWDDAEADFFKALVLKPQQPQVLNYLGYSWIDRGENFEQAREMIERAVELRPNDGYIVDSLGWVHYLTGNYEEAVKQLERAVLLQPNDPTINEHLGDAYWKIGRRIEARYQWRHAMVLDPEPEQLAGLQDKVEFGLVLAEAGAD